MYEHRTEFVTKIEELRLNLPVPKELSPEDFNTGANFEFHPTLKTFLFCWCHDTKSETLWLYADENWSVYTSVKSENLAEHLLNTLNNLDPEITAQMARGCGVVIETLFSLKSERDAGLNNKDIDHLN